MNQLKKTILEAGRSYCPPASHELGDLALPGTGKKASELYYMKAAEDLFLIPTASGALLAEQSTGRILDGAGPDDSRKSGDLCGWHGSLHLAPGLTLECDFGDGVLYFDGTEIPFACSLVGERIYLLALPDGLTLVLDLARFLFYGAAEGKPFGGNITNMTLD